MVRALVERGVSPPAFRLADRQPTVDTASRAALGGPGRLGLRGVEGGPGPLAQTGTDQGALATLDKVENPAAPAVG
jgi:hypothetical protein